MSDDNDIPCLSTQTFDALEEFYREQEECERANKMGFNNNDFQENWHLSQFWYDDNTVNNFVKIVKHSIQLDDRIALISCPTLYKPLKNQLDVNYEVHLYEYDSRFSIFGNEFIKFDYKFPLNIPKKYQHYYNLVIADPPFLSEECLSKTALTIKYVSKEKIILCTGAVMSAVVSQLLSLNKVKFKPSHKNNLANEFCCFSNYDVDQFLLS